MSAVCERLAITDGGPLELPTNTPRDLGQTLERAAVSFPEHGIVFVEQDGSAQFQSYPDLLAEAKRVLGGLQALSLRPGQVVLLQLSRTRDFIGAFWGCVLGGLIPAPLALPANYQDSSGALSKLENAVRLLGGPVILADRQTGRGLREWIARKSPAGVQLAICDELRSGEGIGVPRQNAADETALLMLTSGSTGMPKGVPLTHANLICRSAGSVQLNRFTHRDVALNWMPLDHVAGLIYFHLRDVYIGCKEVQVPTPYILHDPLRWLDCVERFRATITFAPNFAYGLVNERAEEIARRRWDLSSLRWILNGAEAVVARTARKFLQLLIPHGLPPDAMHPAWGMSETSSGVTYSNRFLLETTRDEDAFVEVGRPIPGFSMRIVDDQDRVLKEGELGRLQVKGSTVMRGYYSNPDSNGDVFTADGWFKTGDLGWIKNGQLTLTGREKDVIIIHSVNYYSHEIESVVEQIPGVEPSFTAACGVRCNPDQNERLAIFFSPSNPDERVWPELVQQIRVQVLRQIGANPELIIPVRKTDIPKTEIGKIQRARLKREFEAGAWNEAAKRWDTRQEGELKCPRDLLQSQIAAVWEEVLHVSPIGVDRSFFELGGDSLQATRVLTRLRDAFQVELTLQDLIEYAPTVERMAERIARTRGRHDSSEPIRQIARDAPIPLSFAQQRIWFLDQLDPGNPVFNIPIAIHLTGPLDEAALARSIQDLAERHEILRTDFPLGDFGPEQRVHARPLFELGAAIDLSHGQSSSVLLSEARCSLDLLHGPAWRAGLFRVAPGEAWLLLVFHQIVFDGWSLEVLFRELKEGYLAALGQAQPREPLPVQNADFAVWQRDPRTTARLEPQLKHWAEELAPPLMPLDLKPSLDSRMPLRCDGAVVSKALGDLSRIRAWCRQQSISAFAAFLSVWFVVLRHRTGSSDLRVGTAVSGRQRLELERLIGFFVNTLIIRVNIEGNLSFAELARRVQHKVLRAHANQDVPYEQVVDRVQSRRSGAELPLIQVWFGLQDRMEPFRAGELAFQPSKLDLPVTQFELSLFLREEKGGSVALMEYSTQRFDERTATLLAEQYADLLGYVTREPRADLDSMLCVLREVERRNARSRSVETAERPARSSPAVLG